MANNWIGCKPYDKYHVIPCEDIRSHEESEKCWCKPNDEEGVIVHNALDGREDFETGKRLPS
jgi:hypothetical protein